MENRLIYAKLQSFLHYTHYTPQNYRLERGEEVFLSVSRSLSILLFRFWNSLASASNFRNFTVINQKVGWKVVFDEEKCN